MTMTLTITGAVIQLQLQWYAWVKFLQLLLLCCISASVYQCTSVYQCISVSLYHKTTFQLLISPKLSHCSVLTPICVFKVTILQLASNNSHMCLCDIVTCVIMCFYFHVVPIKHQFLLPTLRTQKRSIDASSEAENCAKLPCHSVTVLFSCVSHRRHVLLRHSWAASNRVRCYLP